MFAILNKSLLLLFLFAMIPNHSQADLYFQEPKDFNPQVEVACLFVEYQGQFLMLHRQDCKSQGNLWGVPAGKLDPYEQPLDAALRETKEETGMDLYHNEVNYVGKVFLKHPIGDLIFHMFKTEIASNPDLVKIKSSEHKGFTWVTPEDALQMNLVLDQDTCIKHVFEKA